MSTSKKGSAGVARRKSSQRDRPVTKAEQRAAIERSLDLDGGAHITPPANGLVEQGNPRETIDRCRGVIEWMARATVDVSSDDLEMARHRILTVSGWRRLVFLGARADRGQDPVRVVQGIDNRRCGPTDDNERAPG
jgi:hypothetical protein